MNVKQTLLNYIKNLRGYSINRKLLVFSVDDYGNIRIDSKEALKNLEASGIKIDSRFDKYDTLETREDLEALLEVLTSVKDVHGNYAVITPFAVPCNIDFEKIIQYDFQEYFYELLPLTFDKLASNQPKAYEGAWALQKQGIEAGIYKPQFHGREHLNLKVFREKLQSKDSRFITALKYRSFPKLGYSGYPSISQMAAFDFWRFEENESFHEIITDGLNAFEQVYGYRSTHFNPPGGRENPIIHKTLFDSGIKYLDTPLIKREHKGEGKYKRVINYTGKSNEFNQKFFVRNVVFEPTTVSSIDWVGYAFSQIAAAFCMRKPAIISSHRVNFCGHIDSQNRKKGLKDLKILLKKVANKWPEVEFLSADSLGNIVSKIKPN